MRRALKFAALAALLACGAANADSPMATSPVAGVGPSSGPGGAALQYPPIAGGSVATCNGTGLDFTVACNSQYESLL